MLILKGEKMEMLRKKALFNPEGDTDVRLLPDAEWEYHKSQ